MLEMWHLVAKCINICTISLLHKLKSDTLYQEGQKVKAQYIINDAKDLTLLSLLFIILDAKEASDCGQDGKFSCLE